jgi:hypothetical protein
MWERLWNVCSFNVLTLLLLSNTATFVFLRKAAVAVAAASTDVAEEAIASTTPASAAPADNCCSC